MLNRHEGFQPGVIRPISEAICVEGDVARRHITFIHHDDVASYAIIFGDSQQSAIPQGLRGYAGILVYDSRFPPTQNSFYAPKAEKALELAIDHLKSLPSHKGRQCVIEDGIDLL